MGEIDFLPMEADMGDEFVLDVIGVANPWPPKSNSTVIDTLPPTGILKNWQYDCYMDPPPI